MKLEFSQHIFEKSLDIKFHQVRLAGVELFHADTETDEQT
jgi:hypothetical protein